MKTDIQFYDFTENVLPLKEAKALAKIQREFIDSYVKHKNSLTTKEWLSQELHGQLPNKTEQEINVMCDEIIAALDATEKMKTSQQKAVEAGRDKYSWFASTIQKATSSMSVQEAGKYLQGMDDAISKANRSMYEAVMTKNSEFTQVSQNPNLDGYIAEQMHVNSYNMKAAARGATTRAEVPSLKPGDTYSKNGFDIVIKDNNGVRQHQYQLKYGRTAEDTIRLIKSGNYNNQILVVPQDQVEEVQKAFPNKTVTDSIGEGDLRSEPLTKEQIKKIQQNAQEKQNILEVEWNDFTVKDVALGLGKQIGYATVQGAAVSAGMGLAKKVFSDEPVEGEEVVATALKSGADFGVKTATAGAIKAASEKGVISSLPKGTSGATIANVAFVAVENAKVLGKVASGDLTVTEGVDAMASTTLSCMAGLSGQAKGAALGASMGSIFGPVGTAVGGFVGGTVGYIAGSTVGKAVVSGAKKVAKTAGSVVKSVVKSVGSVVSSVANGIGNAISSFFSLF